MDKGLHELYLSDKEWRRMAILQDQFKRRRKKKVRGNGWRCHIYSHNE